MGDAPDWYWLVRAARYLGVAPWELLERPPIWIELALAAFAAEDASWRDLHPGSG